MPIHLVTAIIKPFKLDEVKDALRAAGALGLTVSEVQGYGRQGGKTETFRGSEYKIDFVPKVKIEVLVESDKVDPLIEALTAAPAPARSATARSGRSRSTVSCGSAPAKSATRRSERATPRPPVSRQGAAVLGARGRRRSVTPVTSVGNRKARTCAGAADGSERSVFFG